MSLLPFGTLPPARPRAFVPVNADLGDPAQIAPLFDELERRAARAGTPAALEAWLLDWSELAAALDEEGARRSIAMTCHTEDAGAERAHLHFIEKVEPELKPRQFALEKAYIAHPCRAALAGAGGRYAVFDRDVASRVALFRPENVALETEEARLGQQYQKRIGAQTVFFRDRERTLVQMSRFLEEPDRDLRREAWELVARRRLQDAEACEELFDRLVSLRTQIARNAGFPDYLQYAFRQKGRFDYSPADCVRFHGAIEEEIMPAVLELQARRKALLKLDALRPWDLAADPENRPPLRPFTGVADLIAGTARIMGRLDAGLAADFRGLQELNLLDLDNRKGKAPGGYQATLSEARQPFIFMNAVGVQKDVETLLHEAGHAFHALAARGDDLLAYRSAPIEFCEVASMAMELLGADHLGEFYPGDPAAVRRARRTHLEGILAFFPWMAVVDAFQHWVYTHPGHDRAARREAYEGLMRRFGGAVDWSGHGEARAYSWHRQLHIFLHPFYYVEYGIAQLGALQVWANSRADGPRALAAYKAALALGGSRPLPELFAAAGCPLRFDAAAIRPLVARVRAALAEDGPV